MMEMTQDVIRHTLHIYVPDLRSKPVKVCYRDLCIIGFQKYAVDRK